MMGLCVRWVKRISIGMIFTTILTMPSWAEEIETHAQLQSAVESFIQNQLPDNATEQLHVTVSALSHELTLTACQLPLHLSFPRGSSLANARVISVQCPDMPGWQVYVPVRIERLTGMLVANRKITSGEPITPDLISYEKRDSNGFHDQYYTTPESMLGLSAARSIEAGMPFTNKNTKKIALIKRNQPVTLLLRKGLITISMLGVAKSDGYFGEQVQVMNPSSNKIIDAVATGYGKAELND